MYFLQILYTVFIILFQCHIAFSDDIDKLYEQYRYEYRNGQSDGKVCRHYTALLATQLIETNKEFDIIIMEDKYFPTAARHCYISYNDKTYDVVNKGYWSKNYRILCVMQYRLNQDANIAVISQVNCWLQDIPHKED